MDLPHDVWGLLFHLFSSESMDAGLRLRLNKSSNDAFFKLIQRQPEIYPRRTMIQMNVCMHCDRVTEHIGCISYLRDEHPRRQLLFCRRLECLVHALARFIQDANKERVFPFVKFEKRRIWVPRSSGGFSAGQIIANSPLSTDRHGNICAFARMTLKIVQNPTCEPHDNDQLTLEKKVPLSNVQYIGHVDLNSIFCRLFVIQVSKCDNLI